MISDKMNHPWIDFSPKYESKKVEQWYENLFDYSKFNPTLVNPDTNPNGFIRNITVNATKPFIHITQPALFADIAQFADIYADIDGMETLRERGKHVKDTPQTVDQMIEKVRGRWPERSLYGFYEQSINFLNPMTLFPSNKERIQIICRSYSLWVGSFLKLLRTHSDKYKAFKDLQVRYRDGVAAGLYLESKEETRYGHHNWLEFTLDGKKWETLESIFPHDPGHPPEYYLTMDQVYKRFKMKLDENNVSPGRHVDPVQTYNQYTVRDVLFLLNETIPPRDFVKELRYDGIKLEQKRKKEMTEKERVGFMTKQLPKELKVFKALKRDVFPVIADPDVDELRDIREHIDYELKPF